MARITVEDCIDKFPSRFELVLVASNRARKLYSGETPTVEIDNDKNTVIALREIAQESMSIENLKNDLVEEYQTMVIVDDEEANETSEEDENNEANNTIDAINSNQLSENSLTSNTEIETSPTSSSVEEKNTEVQDNSDPQINFNNESLDKEDS